MKSILALLMAAALSAAAGRCEAQTPTTRSGRPVDPKAVENLNRINDERARRGQPPITAPGYTYVPAGQRAAAGVEAAAPGETTAEPKTSSPATGAVSGQPLDSKMVENLDRMNAEREKLGHPLITLPGYTYTPPGGAKSKQTSAATQESAAPAALRWVELVNRTELWPTRCTLKQTMQFQGGVTVKAGQKVKVDGIKPNEVELSTLDDQTQFAAAPEETDVLAAANEAYAKLTPKQRRLTYESLTHQRELWPYRVSITQTFDLGRGQRVRPGDEAVLLNIERGQLFVLSEKFRATYNVAPPATDLMAQARKFVEDTDGTPSRLITELEGKLVNSVTGKPDPLPASAQPRYLVFFRGSSTCAITRKFAPALVKYDQETKAKHPEYEIVYIMTETPEDTGKFAKELGFSWRAVEYATTGKMPVTNAGKTFSDLIPQLVVMDRTGKVLANGIQGTAPDALAKLDALLNQPAQPQ